MCFEANEPYPCFRSHSPQQCEKSEESLTEEYFYSSRTRAYAPVVAVGKYGIVVKPDRYERFFPYSAAVDNTAQVALYDSAKETVKNVDKTNITVGDNVFILRINPYTRMIMIRR